MNPTERLMIVRLSASQWYPRRFDKDASDELAKLHGRNDSRDVGRFNKILIELESIRPIQKAIGRLKTKHYAMTAPWTDDGERVLPVELYFEYTQMVREARNEIASLVADFARDEYPRQRELARVRLNGLFKQHDYPEPSEIPARFDVTYRFEPLPNPDDVRAWGSHGIDVDAMRDEVRASVEATIQASQREVVERLVQRAREFVEKVRKYDNEETRSIYKTAVTNLRDIVELVVNGLNVADDANLTAFAVSLQEALEGVDSDKLKEGEDLRKRKLAEVDAIAKKFAPSLFGATS